MIEAIRRLADDEAFTQENAVKHGDLEAPRTEEQYSTSLLVKVGKKKFCEITLATASLA